MTKGQKNILGIFTFLPAILMLIYFVAIIVLIRDALVFKDEDMPFPILGDVLWLVILALLMGLLSFGLMVYYIIHAINNPQIDNNEKIIWVLLFVLASVVSFPIYWYMRIFKRHEIITMSAT
jgi:NADH:ubiquinone oxidoreductase subunit 6 (subunit J)